jgi:hypothetical protein
VEIMPVGAPIDMPAEAYPDNNASRFSEKKNISSSQIWLLLASRSCLIIISRQRQQTKPGLEGEIKKKTVSALLLGKKNDLTAAHVVASA